MAIFKKLQASDYEKGELFENSNLENLTRTKPLTAILFYGSIWLALIIMHFYLGGIGAVKSLIIYFIAVLFWTLFEYLAHRFLFHLKVSTAAGMRFHQMIHGIHHDFPRDTERLIMPPLPGFIIACFLTGLFYLLLGNVAFVFTAGFINGWALYVSIHYIIHAYQPIEGFKILWTHHAKHHYKEANKAFGVSSVFWDKIFGTMPD